jgi:RecA/RadA recombinase
MEYFSTGVKSLDKLLEGGILLGAPALIFGIPNLGKSWFAFQLACMCTRNPKYGGLGRPVLYLDTEAFFTGPVFRRFYNYFKNRWPDLPNESKIEIKIIKDIFDLGKLFGIYYEILHEDKRVSVISRFPTQRQKTLMKSGKTKLRETMKTSEYIKDSEIWQNLEKKQYGLVVIDSLTAPIKSVIPSSSQNFPARANILQELLGTFYTICRAHNCCIFLTDHITRNPMSPGYAYGLGTPWGGQDITYYVKIQLGLYRALKEQKDKFPGEGHRLRRIERHRYPGLEKELILVWLAKDTGYKDLPPVSGSVARPA